MRREEWPGFLPEKMRAHGAQRRNDGKRFMKMHPFRKDRFLASLDRLGLRTNRANATDLVASRGPKEFGAGA
jgi:hypothetical protein